MTCVVVLRTLSHKLRVIITMASPASLTDALKLTTQYLFIYLFIEFNNPHKTVS